MIRIYLFPPLLMDSMGDSVSVSIHTCNLEYFKDSSYIIESLVFLICSLYIFAFGSFRVNVTEFFLLAPSFLFFLPPFHPLFLPPSLPSFLPFKITATTTCLYSLLNAIERAWTLESVFQSQA